MPRPAGASSTRRCSPGLDLVAEYGPFAAVEHGIRIAATGGEGVVVRPTAQVGETIVGSLRL